jgi:oligoendopeptidase F
LSTTTETARRYDLGPWDLSELLPAGQTVDRRFESIESAVRELEQARAELSPEIDRARFLEIFATFEQLVERIYALSAYGSLRFSADTQSSEVLALRSRIDQRLTEVQNRILFLDLWWKGLTDEEAERLLPPAGDQTAADLRFHLEDQRRLKPFTLEERAEQIVNLKDVNGVNALLKVYSMLTNRLEFEIEVDGEKQTLTRDQLMSHVFSPRPELREAAYREQLRVFEREAAILGEIYVHRVRDWHSENRDLRGFASPIAVRNTANDIPDAAVDVLLDVAVERREVFQRYFRWKAERLGVEKLRRFDVFAPLAGSDKRVEYGDAVELVLDTFERFDPGFARAAERVFEERHIDGEIRKGKRGGAFCATVLPHQTPWLLLNYTGRVRDVATLAHELGHAVHSMLAAEHSVFTQHASLPLAETASVFGEMLLTDRLLAEESSPSVRRELLASALDDVYATVQRQAYFVRFEKAAHEAILAGASPDDLHGLYFGLLEEQFGDSLELAPEFRHEWVAIPHIYHTPFYCYAYSFGQLLVLSLYRRYQKEGKAFIPGYLRLLAHGGSARPEAILAEAGVDVSSAEFWRGGYRVIEDLLEELEAVE